MGMLKPNIRIAIVMASLVPWLSASQNQNSNQHVRGIVTGVKKQRIDSAEYAIAGSSPSDAPLTSRYYAFDVSVRVDCTTYTGRYTTPLNYLPSIFTPAQPIQLRLTRHVMYFDLPNDPDMKMGIIRRRRDCDRSR